MKKNDITGQEKENEYQQYSIEQLFQVASILAPIYVAVLIYFIFSDIYIRKMPTWAYTRFLPIISFGVFYAGLRTQLKIQKPHIVAGMYYLAMIVMLCMSFEIAVIAWESSHFQTSAIALFVVVIGMFLGLRGSLICVVLVYFIPVLLFIIYVFLFVENTARLADFANHLALLVAIISLYGYDEKLRRKRFIADRNLTNAHKKMSIMATELQVQNRDLQEALEKVKQLSGLLPICANCKKIRDEEGSWHQIEAYIPEHSEAHFSHSLCPVCTEHVYPDYFKMKKNQVR